MLFSLLYFQPHRLENCRCHRRSTITRSAKKKVDDQKSVKKEKKDCKRPLVAPFFNNADVLSSILLKKIVFRVCLHELSFSFFSVFNKYLVFFCIYLHMQLITHDVWKSLKKSHFTKIASEASYVYFLTNTFEFSRQNSTYTIWFSISKIFWRKTFSSDFQTLWSTF